MDSAHTGTVTLEVDGERVPIRFTWAGISSFQVQFGKEWDEVLSEAIANTDMSVIARALAIGSPKTADWWADKSPPITETCQALQLAVRVAFDGPRILEKEKSGNPRRPLSPSLTTLWQGLFGSGAKRRATL